MSYFSERDVEDFLMFNIDMTGYCEQQAKLATNDEEKDEWTRLGKEAGGEDLWHFEATNRRGNTVHDFAVQRVDPYSVTNSPERLARLDRYAAQIKSPGFNEDIGIVFEERRND